MAPTSAPTIAQRLPPAPRTPRAAATCARTAAGDGQQAQHDEASDPDRREIRRHRVDERAGDDQRRSGQDGHGRADEPDEHQDGDDDSNPRHAGHQNGEGAGVGPLPAGQRFWYLAGAFIGAKNAGRAIRPTRTSISTGRSIPTALRTRSPTSVGLVARMPTTP